MIDYPSEPRRRAEFIFPANTLKAKAGSGGLDETLIDKAQKLIDTSRVDFMPIGQRYLSSLQEGIKTARGGRGQIDDEALIATMLYPAMQLKANGGMFRFPLITSMAARLVRFLEQLRLPDDDALEIVSAFADSLNAILMMGEKAQEISQHGGDLYQALDDACARYFVKYGF